MAGTILDERCQQLLLIALCDKEHKWLKDRRAKLHQPLIKKRVLTICCLWLQELAHQQAAPCCTPLAPKFLKQQRLIAAALLPPLEVVKLLITSNGFKERVLPDSGAKKAGKDCNIGVIALGKLIGDLDNNRKVILEDFKDVSLKPVQVLSHPMPTPGKPAKPHLAPDRPRLVKGVRHLQQVRVSTITCCACTTHGSSIPQHKKIGTGACVDKHAVVALLLCLLGSLVVLAALPDIHAHAAVDKGARRCCCQCALKAQCPYTTALLGLILDAAKLVQQLLQPV